MNTRNPRIGEVYMMKFGGSEHEQSGLRPGIVFQNNIGNEKSPNIIAIPLTSSIKKLNMPSHVLIKASRYGLRKDSVALCEGPERLSKEKIGFYITTLSADDMRRIARANVLATSVISFLSQNELLDAWRASIALNKEMTTAGREGF